MMIFFFSTFISQGERRRRKKIREKEAYSKGEVGAAGLQEWAVVAEEDGRRSEGSLRGHWKTARVRTEWATLDAIGPQWPSAERGTSTTERKSRCG